METHMIVFLVLCCMVSLRLVSCTKTREARRAKVSSSELVEDKGELDRVPPPPPFTTA